MRPAVFPKLNSGALRIHLCSPKPRCYSAKVPGDDKRAIRTLADIKEFRPAQHVSDIEVCGWVRSVRKSSGVRFVDLTDGSSMRPVQAVVDKNLSAEYVLSTIPRIAQHPCWPFSRSKFSADWDCSIRPGTAVRFKGTWKPGNDTSDAHVSATSGIVDESQPVQSTQSEDAQPITMSELQVSSVEILGSSDPAVCPSAPCSPCIASHLMNNRRIRYKTSIKHQKACGLLHTYGLAHH